MRYPKKYTMKEWNRFDIDMQEKLCERYNVFLTDHKTKKEKLFAVMDKFNAKNLNAGITKFNKGVDSFNKSIASTSKGKGPDLSGLSPKKGSGFGISQKEYDSLFGSKSKKSKGNSISFWDEDRQTRKRRNKRTAKTKEVDYSALIGTKRMKFF